MKVPLILVVGPSGAGKDSLIGGARQALAGDRRVHFARRVVTRPADAGGEDHLSMSEASFVAAEQRGDFLLSWRAHGLGYGIPRELDRLRLDGTALVANVSRSVVDLARNRLGPVGIIVVTASLATLARRIAERGREDETAAMRRLHRAGAALPAGPDVLTLVNDGALDSAIAEFIAALRLFCPAPPAQSCEGTSERFTAAPELAPSDNA